MSEVHEYDGLKEYSIPKRNVIPKRYIIQLDGFDQSKFTDLHLFVYTY